MSENTSEPLVQNSHILAINAGVLWKGEIISPNRDYEIYTEQLTRNQSTFREVTLPRRLGFSGVETRACGTVTDSLSGLPLAGLPASIGTVWDADGEDIELFHTVATDSTGAFCLEAFEHIGISPFLWVNRSLRWQAAPRDASYSSLVQALVPGKQTQWDVGLAPR